MRDYFFGGAGGCFLSAASLLSAQDEENHRRAAAESPRTGLNRLRLSVPHSEPLQSEPVTPPSSSASTPQTSHIQFRDQ